MASFNRYHPIKLLKRSQARLTMFVITLFCLLTSFLPTAHAAPLVKSSELNDKNILIVYYSRTDNTEEVAKHIRAQIGGELVRLQTVDPYPDQYRATTVQAKKELESDYRPPVVTKIDNIAQYDIIFIGSPNWWGTMSMPVRSFLYEYDLTGKTLVPFITHEGNGLGRTMQDLKIFQPNATILDGLAIRGGNAKYGQRDVQQWLKRLAMMN